ncbi:MAG TPA: DUF3108 domain-containing protein [Sneathiellales bacterium]|nr:DUF3108 domain-containing protein [Sneathiellales bacterium]
MVNKLAPFRQIVYRWAMILKIPWSWKIHSPPTGIVTKVLKTLLISTILLAVSSAARSDSTAVKPIELAYDIFIGGFLAGTVDITFRSGIDRYHIISTGRSHGVLDFLIGFRGRNEVAGHFLRGRAKPLEYTAKGLWAGEERSVEIEYGPGAGLRFRARPTAVEDERDPVPTHLLAGTTDPLSAWFQTMLRVTQSARCDGGMAVFDGRRRYDISFEELAVGSVTGPLHTGPARICRVRQTLIAGRSHRTWLPQFARPEWFDIWIATVGEDLPALPVRLHADLGIVDLVTQLVAVGGRKLPPGESLPTPAPAGETNADRDAGR